MIPRYWSQPVAGEGPIWKRGLPRVRIVRRRGGGFVLSVNRSGWNCMRSSLCLATIVCLMGGLNTWGEEAPRGAAVAPPEAPWRPLLRQLSAEDYQERVSAERALAAMPSAEALPSLAELAAGDVSETSARAVNILEAWLVHAPQPLAGQVDQLFDRLQHEAPAAMGQLCRQVLETHRRLRWERAVARLRELGAKVDWGPDYAEIVQEYCARHEEPILEEALAELHAQMQPRDSTGEPGDVSPDVTAEPAAPPDGWPRAPRHVFLTAAWKGTEADLGVLRQLAGAWRVHIYNVCKPPQWRAAVLEVTANVEGVTVIDRGPSLGVSSRDRTYCRIDQVLAGGAAERAGLKPGDLVLQVDDVPINNFEHLVRTIGDFQPGQTVKLQLLREGRLLQTVATLGDWTDVQTEAGLWNGREVADIVEEVQIRRMQMLLQVR